VVGAARGPYDRPPLVRTALTMLTVLAGIMLVVVCANLTNLSMALTTQRPPGARGALRARRNPRTRDETNPDGARVDGLRRRRPWRLGRRT
jgi:hypothetical protein